MNRSTQSNQEHRLLETEFEHYYKDLPAWDSSSLLWHSPSTDSTVTWVRKTNIKSSMQHLSCFLLFFSPTQLLSFLSTRWRVRKHWTKHRECVCILLSWIFTDSTSVQCHKKDFSFLAFLVDSAEALVLSELLHHRQKWRFWCGFKDNITQVFYQARR